MSALATRSRRLGLDPRAALGISVLVVGSVIWVLAFTGFLSHLFGPSTFTVTADFSSIEDIVPGDPVRIDGVQVGTVATERALKGGRGARLTMSINNSAGPVYNNASAAILWRTVLGANDAISLNPGTRAAGKLGSAILPIVHDSNQVELDQITQGALQGAAQSGIRTLVQQFGPALASRDSLKRDFGTLANVAPAVNTGVGALRGEVQDTDLRNLVKNAGQAAQALSVGTSGSETRQFVESAATTLTAVSANQTDLADSITAARQLLPDLQTVAKNTNATLYRLDPLVKKLTPEVPKVAPTLVALHPALKGANKLLTEAQPLFVKLVPTVSSLTSAANIGVPVIDAFSPTLDKLKDTVLPGLDEKYPEEGGRPMFDMLGALLVGIGTLGNYFDQDGNTANLSFGLENAEAQEILPCTTDFSKTDLLVCESLSDSLSELLTGGTSVLKSLVTKTSGTPAQGQYSALMKTALTSSNLLSSVKSDLTKVAPAAAHLLFDAVSTVKK